MTQTLEPKALEELADSVRSTGAQAIATIGAGMALGFGNPATREDIALQTRALNRIVDYTPEDQVVVVEAGVTLCDLQGELGKRGQRLAIDPLGGDGATIGGMLATNAYGPMALRYGTLKDLIVGVEMVRADGVVAHAGGKVVKNVAGFDVSKLIVGSLGTLAIITKATFRVHPLPEKTTCLAFSAKLEQVFPFVLALREAQLEPASIAVRFNGAADVRATAVVEIAFEGFGPGVDAQSGACENVAAATGVTLSVVSAANVACAPEGIEAQPKYRLKATFPPAEFARIAREIDGEALAYPSLGVIYFGGPSTTGAQGAPYARDDKSRPSLERIQLLRATFESLGGTLVVRDMPEEWRGKIDAWGTPPPAFKLMRALKQRFDPDYRLNPGRFVGGL